VQPTAPIELRGHADRWSSAVDVPSAALAELSAATTVVTDVAETADASRDWWPLAMHWALAGEVPARARVVCRPTSTAEVAAMARVCNRHGVPLTAAGGRSAVTGAAVPAFGGVLADLTGLAGVGDVDEDSGVVEVAAGTSGPELEEFLGRHGLSVGHFPQSFELATVGGWVACRGAGQYSTRYGKIEDLVAGLEVVLADGTVVRTGGAPAAASGPDLTQLFCGSEGTLGLITRVWLRTHPTPPAEQRAAYSFATFADGVEACRQIMRIGATPAVLRLYDTVESAASGRGGDGSTCTLLVLDEGDRRIVEATMAVVADACRLGAPAPAELVATWIEHRNDTSALEALTRQGYIVDTMEIAARWSRLEGLFDGVRARLGDAGAKVASCHLSHSYPDGACLYFTFAAKPDPADVESTYRALWDAGQQAVLDGGGNLSHHHGIGINRGRFVADALGDAFGVLCAVKRALDPNGIFNPGKLGLPSPFGEAPWP